MIIGNQDRLRVVRLEHMQILALTAMNAIRATLICADRKRDESEHLSVIARIVDRWEQDSSPDAWDDMLRSIQQQRGSAT